VVAKPMDNFSPKSVGVEDDGQVVGNREIVKPPARSGAESGADNEGSHAWIDPVGANDLGG
jgi:hypothetical protein